MRFVTHYDWIMTERGIHMTDYGKEFFTFRLFRHQTWGLRRRFTSGGRAADGGPLPQKNVLSICVGRLGIMLQW